MIFGNPEDMYIISNIQGEYSSISPPPPPMGGMILPDRKLFKSTKRGKGKKEGKGKEKKEQIKEGKRGEGKKIRAENKRKMKKK